MTIPHFTDRSAAEAWLRIQSGTIARLRRHGSADEVNAAIADYSVVAATWDIDVPEPARAQPWYVELAIVAVLTLVLLGLLELTGAIQ